MDTSSVTVENIQRYTQILEKDVTDQTTTLNEQIDTWFKCDEVNSIETLFRTTYFLVLRKRGRSVHRIDRDSELKTYL